MAFHVRDAATDLAVRKLARLKGKTLTETVRENLLARVYADYPSAVADRTV